MNQHRDLWSAIQASATSDRGITILGKGDASSTLSYRTIVDRAAAVAGALWNEGIRPGDRIGLIPDTNFSFIIGCVASWRLGCTVVSLPPPSRLLALDAWLDQTARRVEKANVKALLIDEAQAGFPAPVPTYLVSSLDGDEPPPAADGSVPALIQFTSGSTGDPRGVVLSHGALMGHIEAFDELVRVEGDPRVFNWLPLYHDLGLVDFTLWPLCRANELTLLPPQLFLADPWRWVEGLARSRATHTAGPNFAYGLVARFAAKHAGEEIDLSSVRVLGSGGEVVDAATTTKFLTALEPFNLDPKVFAVGYGMAEVVCANITQIPGTGPVFDVVDRESLSKGTATPADEGDAKATRFSSCGVPMGETEMMIDGADGEERRIGEVLIRCAYLMDGFLDEPEATSRVVTPDGWFRTGDTGYIANGELFVTGRIKDVIIVRGFNYYAEDVERVANEVEGVRRGNVIAFGASDGSTEHLVIAAESKLQDEDALQRCRDEIAAKVLHHVGLAPKEVLLLAPGTVPKTSSGKLQRNEMRQRYARDLAQTH